MKSKMFLIAFLLFSTKIFAQLESSLIQPELFRLTNLWVFYCTESNVGLIYYYADDINKLVYCASANELKLAGENWAADGSDIYTLGKVGILNTNPTYDLDVNFTARTQNAIVNGNVGINTTTPTEKLELVNRAISISSTIDNYAKRIENNEANNRLDLYDNGQRIMNVNYGGNITIGQNQSINTHKLYVAGDGSYASTLSVEGKGILSNTSATQLVMHTVTSVITGGFFIVENNTCDMAVFSFPSGTFTAPPAIFLGQNLSAIKRGETLTKSIVNVTTGTGQIRFCNNSGADVNLSDQTFSVIAIGQGN